MGPISQMLHAARPSVGAVLHSTGHPAPAASHALWSPGSRLHVLIMSADLAGGHDALAQALKSELLTRMPTASVSIINSLADANPLAYSLMKKAMVGQITHAPSTYETTYRVVTTKAATSAVRTGVDVVYGRGLQRRIAADAPDVVVSTFPMTTSALGTLKRSGKIDVPVVAAATDADAHAMWFARGVDSHTVFNPNDARRATERSMRDASLRGINITTTRPPVDPRLADPVDVSAVRGSFDLPQDRPVVLVSGGSLGLVIPPQDIAKLHARTGATVAVATGRNEGLYRELAAAHVRSEVAPIPFTKEMPSLLKSVDAMIANAGGMTTYESFAAGTPVLFYKPLPGHGVDAARALADDGFATLTYDIDSLATAVHNIIDRRGPASHTAAAASSIFTLPSSMSDAVLGAAALR
jgi:UDP-N-acetylglucosamine:LPS N-acetylglucosamine transferase